MELIYARSLTRSIAVMGVIQMFTVCVGCNVMAYEFVDHLGEQGSEFTQGRDTHEEYGM